MKRSWKRNRSRALRRNPQKFTQHAADVLEPRVLLSATTAAPAAKTPAPTASSVESFNGAGNNVANPTWGQAGNDLCGSLPHNMPTASIRRRCRKIPAPGSSRISSTTRPIRPIRRKTSRRSNQQSLSDFVYSFGQFMDHDMDLTQGNGAADNISVPVGDPIGGPNDTPLVFQPVADRSGDGHEHQQSRAAVRLHQLRISTCRRSTVRTWRPTTPCGRFLGGQMKTSRGWFAAAR